MFNEKKITACIIALFILVTINKAAYSLNTYSKKQFSNNYQSVSETITALDITRKKYQELLLAQYSPIKDKTIIKEYSIFIDYLSFKINSYCTKLIKEYGEESVQDLACSTNHLEENTNDNHQTTEEKIESLDGEFMTALGEFDEMLLIEDEKIAQINQNKADQGSDRSSEGNGTENLSGKEAGKEKNTNSNSNTNKQNTTSENSRSKGKNNQARNKSYKRKKLDQIDDDIVARQLKEAAEKETNPELKEKIWDEYYKYKQTIGKE